MDHETIRVITESIVGVGLIFIIGGVVFIYIKHETIKQSEFRKEMINASRAIVKYYEENKNI